MVGIYKITNKVNGKIYVGQSIDIDERFLAHRREAPPKMHEDVELFGWENFAFEVLEERYREVLNDRENFYIEKLNPEYNTIKKHNWTHTPETCEKIRQAKLGSQHTEESCEKMSKSRKGVKLSEEHKEKCRQKSIGNKSRSRGVICVETGIEYENAKIAAQAVGLKSSTVINKVIRGELITAAGYHWKCTDEDVIITSRSRKVLCIETGETFSSVQEAAEHFDLTPSVVSKVLHGKSITAGLHFKFADESLNKNIRTDESRKISSSKSVMCIETNEIFSSVKAAAEHFGLNHSNICRMLKGGTKKVGGLRFKYI